MIEGILDGESPLVSRLESLDSGIERVNEDRDRLDLRMESLESRLRAQFGALDQLVGELTASGNFLSQQLSSLPGFVRESPR
jgi:flagellar hook-associated protein 2